jgi:hypothetical protein
MLRANKMELIVDDFSKELRDLADAIDEEANAEVEPSEFSARARKKKRIYKRKKAETKPVA